MYSSSEYPLCRHFKPNGRRCQSPALTTSAFCFHHRKLHGRRPSTGPGHSTSVLHPLRKADSIQQALEMVVSGLAGGRIHTKEAGRMLFALQTATLNLDKVQQNHNLSRNPSRCL
jgi:hypothetical protein